MMMAHAVITFTWYYRFEWWELFKERIVKNYDPLFFILNFNIYLRTKNTEI